MAQHPRQWRPEVQGLRGLAVLLVVVGHVCPDLLPGGYVGVDVFFVVSGYLITGLLLAEVTRTGRVDLWQFWVRRAQRLLPSATVVLAVTAVASWLLLPSGRWASTARQLVASALSLQNWELARAAVDYQASSAAASPVQHAWSLSVEEQFYLLWPVVIAVAAVLVAVVSQRTRGRALRGSLRRPALVVGLLAAGVVAASAAHAVAATAASPAAAYFSSTARAWELALGGLLAALGVLGCATSAAGTRAARTARAALGVTGLLAIGVAAWVSGPDSSFPGPAAALPVLGTAAVLVAVGPAAHLLALRPLRWVGDISYPLYLWHWPVLVLFLAGTSQQAVSRRGAAVVILLSTALAVLTRALVEDPLRRAPLVRTSPLLAVLLVGACLVTSGGAAVALSSAADRAARPSGTAAGLPGAAVMDDPATALEGRTGPFVPGAVAALEQSMFEGRTCQQNASSSEVLHCAWGPPDAETTIAVFGDSHASRWLPPLRALAEASASRGDQHGVRVVVVAKGGCSPSAVPQVMDGALYATCSAWVDDAVGWLRSAHPDVVLSAGYAKREVLGADSAQQAQDVLADGYVEVWRQLQQDGVRVVAVRDTPWMGGDAAECVEREGADVARCDRPRVEALEARDPQVLAAGHVQGVDVLDLSDSFCTPDVCPAAAGGVLVYMDDSHTTLEWALSLAPALERQLTRLGVLPGRG